ncbi:hypothetical protein MC885_012107 [Smutsia gigantea]|nr:hypothetical protein MC885_012107 [Smutsia gigantea]
MAKTSGLHPRADSCTSPQPQSPTTSVLMLSSVVLNEDKRLGCRCGSSYLENTIPLGSMAINSITKLTQLSQSSMYSLPNAPTLADLEDDEHEDNENQPEKPHFDSRSVIFELDPCNGNGKVCLVYKRGKPVSQAQGSLDQKEQWFNMYKPITYNTNLLTEETDSFVNKLDPSKVFKSKNKTLIPKKKGPVQPASGQKGPFGPPSTSKSSSGSVNSVRK